MLASLAVFDDLYKGEKEEVAENPPEPGKDLYLADEEFSMFNFSVFKRSPKDFPEN